VLCREHACCKAAPPVLLLLPLLQVQMTLTPQVRPLPPNLQASGRAPIAGQAPGNAAGGVLVPLLTGCADTSPRLAAVLGAMAGDLLGRVLLDRCAAGCGRQCTQVVLSAAGRLGLSLRSPWLGTCWAGCCWTGAAFLPGVFRQTCAAWSVWAGETCVKPCCRVVRARHYGAACLLC
jgi:hypothetical protein